MRPCEDLPVDSLQLVEVCVGVVQQGVHHGGHIAGRWLVLLAYHKRLSGGKYNITIPVGT